MKIKTYASNEEWLADRGCRITGSKLKDIVVKRGTKRKIGFYKLVADRLGVDDGSVDGMDRGHELEIEAIEALTKEVGIKFNTDLVMWESDENPNIAYSPDGYTDDLTATAEAKCLGSARHLQIVIENEIPSEYYEQMIQSFVVNEKQDKHYFISYDPRVTSRPVHIIITNRDDIEGEIQFYLDYQENILEEVDAIVEELAF